MVKAKLVFKLTKHVQARIVQRGIDIKHIKKAVSLPDKKEKVKDGRIRVVKKFKNITISVIYFKDGFSDKPNDIIIVTAYYLT